MHPFDPYVYGLAISVLVLTASWLVVFSFRWLSGYSVGLASAFVF